MLFFAIGLPLIIHYAGGYDTHSDKIKNTTPTEAFMWLGLGAVFWAIIFIYYIKKFVIDLIAKKQATNRLLQQGEKKSGKIISNKILFDKEERQGISIKVSFRNFSDSEVTKSLEFVDTKPYQRRFEVGNNIGLLLDPALKPPYIAIEGQSAHWNKTVLLFIFFGLLLLIGLATGVLTYSYIHESKGYGWRYLSFWHPYLMIPASFIFYFGLFAGISRFFINDMKPYMFFYGKKTDARIDAVRQTGTEINNQPQLLFSVSYKDDMGRTYQASFKKVVNLLHLAGLQPDGVIPIMYDPKNPNRIEFYEED
jgi:hypothetical protein